LGEGNGHDHHEHGEKEEHHEEGAEGGGEERELLPWLKLSAELDPQRPETYVVAAFWLRSRLGNVTQAEQFLRQGLQANPGHYEILFELGQIYYDNRKDPYRARNLWELALRDWRERDSAHADPTLLVLLQILGHLARLEEEQKDYARAIAYLDQLKLVSPSRPAIEKWIGELRQKIGPPN
jgi:tetratricopeptide (TPR) repeat protein